MKTKVLYGGLAGGVAFFLLGWLIYGELLMNFMMANQNQCIALPMEEMKWWAIILSNLLNGLVIAMVLDWSGSNDMMSGAKTAAIFGFLICSIYDLGLYSMTSYFLGRRALVVDIAAGTLMMGIGGMIIGFIYSKLKTE